MLPKRNDLFALYTYMDGAKYNHRPPHSQKNEWTNENKIVLIRQEMFDQSQWQNAKYEDKWGTRKYEGAV